MTGHRDQGNPTDIDVVLGTILTVLLLEATRRTVGWVLPIIIVLIIALALYGPQVHTHGRTQFKCFGQVMQTKRMIDLRRGAHRLARPPTP